MNGGGSTTSARPQRIFSLQVSGLHKLSLKEESLPWNSVLEQASAFEVEKPFVKKLFSFIKAEPPSPDFKIGIKKEPNDDFVHNHDTGFEDYNKCIAALQNTIKVYSEISGESYESSPAVFESEAPLTGDEELEYRSTENVEQSCARHDKEIIEEMFLEGDETKKLLSEEQEWPLLGDETSSTLTTNGNTQEATHLYNSNSNLRAQEWRELCCSGKKSTPVTCNDQNSTHSRYRQEELDAETESHSVHPNRHGLLYKCDDCNKYFTVFESLMLHIKHHVLDSQYKCAVCVKYFVHKSNFKKHVLSHLYIDQDKARSFKCGACNKVFAKIRSLKAHIHNHFRDKIFKCDICGSCFKRKEVLEKHKIVHSEEKPFTSDVCQKTFKRKHDMVIHKRKHLGIRPYECGVCRVSFARSSDLSRHKRMHANSSEENQYKCSTCDKTFLRKDHLKSHENRVHSAKTEEMPNKWVGRDERLAKSCSLVKHKCTVHSESRCHNRRYICDMCGKTFCSSSGLNKHRVIHSEERRFKCQVCSKGFKRKDQLKVHEGKHSDAEKCEFEKCLVTNKI
ncbi:zinc finger protein 16 [Elysia marginata]|uniref:Zinc finger protein 16 n=1 Tax=Elysia marginata TaxID=1093978 RepID=A0AAV4GMH1_9GAST|nr:zinc finger protein 16 [Elysia marginata]